MRNEPYNPVEVQAPILLGTLNHIKEIANHSRSKVIPIILKI
ncbi:MAG: hypothetical protein WC389_02600 [Lutibacter sp.]